MTGRQLGIGLTVATIALVVVMVGWAAQKDRTPEVRREVAMRKAEAAARVDARLALEGSLRDPSSVQYGRLDVVPQADGSSVVCGTYNAKNGFGGYVGERPFMVRNGTLLTGDPAGSAFSLLWKKLC